MTQTAVQPTPSRARKRPLGIWIALVIVLLVMVAAVIFGGSGISRATTAQRDARQVEAIGGALPEAFDLAVYLASERAAAEAGVPIVVMRPVEAQTDVAIEEWDAEADSIASAGDEELATRIAEIQRSLAGLGDLRAQMRDAATRAGAVRGYTDLASSLFGLAERVPSLGDDMSDAKIDALRNLGPAWEALGQERAIMLALMNEKITADATGTAPRARDEEIAVLSEAEAQWRGSIGDFYTETSDQQRLALDELTDGTAEDGAVGVPALKVVNEIIDDGVDEVTMAPDMYVSSSTQFVDGLRRISVAAAEEVAADATQARQDASSVALLITIGVVCVIAFLLVIALVLLVLGVVLSRRRA